MKYRIGTGAGVGPACTQETVRQAVGAHDAGVLRRLAATGLFAVMMAGCNPIATDGYQPPGPSGTAAAPKFSWGWVGGTQNTVWSPHAPQPPEHDNADRDYMLLVADGPDNVPDSSAAAKRIPVDLYTDPTQRSVRVGSVPNGTVLWVDGWTDTGQPVGDSGGVLTSGIWLRVRSQGEAPREAWLSWGEVGYPDKARVELLPKVLVNVENYAP